METGSTAHKGTLGTPSSAPLRGLSPPSPCPHILRAESSCRRLRGRKEWETVSLPSLEIQGGERSKAEKIQGNLRSFSRPQALPSPTPVLLIFYIKSTLASRQPFTEPWALLLGDSAWYFCFWLWPRNLSGG